MRKCLGVNRRAALGLAVLLLATRGLGAADLSVGTAAGSLGGLGLQVSAGASGFAKGFPFSVELALGAALQEPGNAAEARKVFINDATDGTPEKGGWDLQGRLDFLYDTRWLKEGRILLGGGVRASSFHAGFKYVGGNEEFEVTSHQWGLGLGAQGIFPMAGRLSFVVRAGLDYFFDAGLAGHDTVYNPDGDNVSPRTGYTYQDADKAVNQPKLVPVALLGLRWDLP